MIKICQRCNAQYEPKSNAQKFCTKCRDDAHRERCRKYAQLRRQQDPVAYNQYHQNWRENHREATRECWRRWAKNNPEKVLQKSKARYRKLHAQRIKEFKKARLRDILKANAEKRQEKQREHDKLYPKIHLDDHIVILPSIMASFNY